MRCASCRSFFDQRIAAQKDCPRCEREPVRAAVVAAPASEPVWRTCTEKGCGVDFRVEKKRGRPAKKCPAHRKGVA